MGREFSGVCGGKPRRKHEGRKKEKVEVSVPCSINAEKHNLIEQYEAWASGAARSQGQFMGIVATGKSGDGDLTERRTSR
jgi:hypothetical protein